MIEFDPIGTITVTIDDETYRLTRPKMGQWRYFQRTWQEAIKAASTQLTDLTTKLDEARDLADAPDTPEKKAKAQKRLDALSDELRTTTVKPLYEWQIPWTRDVFTQLGDKPLPEDSDEWPVWLASDPSLPNQIITHWQAHPKASGVNPN